MMVRHYLLNDDGKTYREIDLFDDTTGDIYPAMEWSKQLANGERRNVGDDEIQGYRVSTKFIGIDSTPVHFNAPPRPFECMAFGPDITEVLGRFTTWEQAANFHCFVMDVLRALEAEGKTLSATAVEIATLSARRRTRGE